jgi:DnaJ-class molecular chaperone
LETSEEPVDEGQRVRIESLAASMDELDYYELLDVDPDAGHDDIRDAFYRFASDFHPDQHGGESAETRALLFAVFKRVNEAYSALTDPKRRKRYDEGLARGEKRLGPERPAAKAVPKDPASSVVTPMGRQFHRLAAQALAKGDLQAARLNLTIARTHEGPNTYLDEQIALVESKIKEKTA